jgi:hypothetical protein
MGMRSCRAAFRTYAQSNGSRDCDVTGGACVTVTTNRSSTCFNRRQRVHQALHPPGISHPPIRISSLRSEV